MTCGPLVTGAKATNGVGDIGGTPVPANAAQGIAADTLQQGSEIHAESGDAFIYGGPADDTIFGGAQDDTIILGYGDNWVSGGRGDQCIVGGGGRCFASRVSSSYGEPLYNIAPIPAGQLNQQIASNDGAEVAEINIANSLQYSVILYPYNWDPSTYVSPGVSNGDPTFLDTCKSNQACVTFSPEFGHNIIYGGWGNGVIHGGPGDSAIDGAEAPAVSYLDNWDMQGNQLNTAAIESDFYHPVNPGNPAGYTPDTAIVHGNPARIAQLGNRTTSNPPTRGWRRCFRRTETCASGPRGVRRPAASTSS